MRGDEVPKEWVTLLITYWNAWGTTLANHLKQILEFGSFGWKLIG